jgi:hypothetical protein
VANKPIDLKKEFRPGKGGCTYEKMEIAVIGAEPAITRLGRGMIESGHLKPALSVILNGPK